MDLIILSPILGGIIRNLSGWVENALKDGKISSYEWGQLLATTIQVAVIGYSAVMLGADPLVGAGAGILGSMAISTVKKVGSSEVKVV
jgi:hypothetical protein